MVGFKKSCCCNDTLNLVRFYVQGYGKEFCISVAKINIDVVLNTEQVTRAFV